MRNHIKTYLIISVLGFLGYMAFAISGKRTEKEALRMRIATVPSFRLERVEGGFFTEEQLSQHKPFILVYFNSGCDLCKLEAKSIGSRLGEFDNAQLAFVSTEEKVDIRDFAQEYGLSGSCNVVFLQDPNLEFSKIFGINTVPATFIYSKKGKLVNQFSGPVKVDFILEALQE